MNAALRSQQFQRREVIARARSLINRDGLLQGEAAVQLGVSPATLSRWLAAYREGGTKDLAPGYDRCGRKKLSCGATEADRVALKRLRLATGSDACALQMWADDARCSPELREAILRPRRSAHNLPRSLRQLCHVTPQDENLFKGERAFQLGGFVQRRDDRVRLADGSERVLCPGDIWEADDMSNNQPFWWELTEEERNAPDAGPLAKRFGVAVGRQVLLARDVRGRWLAHECIGRPRDAYRAADVLGFFRKLYEAHGIPRLGMRLERGIWRAKAIEGVTLPGEQRPGMDDEERENLFGGLQEIGCSVEWCYSPQHKGGIEGGFNYLQRLMAAVACRDEFVADIGRFRGEYERGTKALMQAHAGRKHPRELGILHIDQVRELLNAACLRDNSMQPKEGRIAYGVPDVEWEAAVRADPLRTLPKSKLWVFLPHEGERQLRGGHVAGQVGGVQHQFCCPELFAELGSGYPVRIRFDITEPSLGAWIFNNAPRDARCNVRGLALGEYLGWAEWSPDAPQFDAARGFDARQRKRYNHAVRRSFAALGLFGRRVKPDGSGHAVVAEHRDGVGGVHRVERSLAAAAGRAPSDSDRDHDREITPKANRLTRPERAAPDADKLDALEARLRQRGELIG